MQITRWANGERFLAQSNIIRSVFGTAEHSLETLLDLMRSTGETALYLSGTRLDNDFCFGSPDLGVLLSVLPEDGVKAGEPGYHPGSTEVYVTFQGALVLECLHDDAVVEKASGNQEVVVLPPGQCHRVKNAAASRAASLIVKTGLSYKPGVIRCANCTYYAKPTDCPLHRQWTGEKGAFGHRP